MAETEALCPRGGEEVTGIKAPVWGQISGSRARSNRAVKGRARSDGWKLNLDRSKLGIKPTCFTSRGTNQETNFPRLSTLSLGTKTGSSSNICSNFPQVPGPDAGIPGGGSLACAAQEARLDDPNGPSSVGISEKSIPWPLQCLALEGSPETRSGLKNSYQRLFRTALGSGHRFILVLI